MNSNGPHSVDQTGALIESAGAREEIPAEDLRRIRTVAHDRWRESLQAPARKPAAGRWRIALPLAAGLILALGAVWWLGRAASDPEEPPVLASLALVRGEAIALPPGSAGETRLGSDAGSLPLTAGTRVEVVAGEVTGDASVALTLSAGPSIRLRAGSSLRLISAEVLELERGALYFDSGDAGAAGAPIEVLIPGGSVTDVGTRYELRLGGDTAPDIVRLRVRDGEVAIDRAGVRHRAGSSEELTVDADGRAESRPIETWGEAWRWARTAAPPFEIEGRTLDAFLRWAGREEGRRIVYASPEISTLASSTVLSGSIEGFSPDQAIDFLLEGSGLTSRIVDERRLIDRSDAGSELEADAR